MKAALETEEEEEEEQHMKRQKVKGVSKNPWEKERRANSFPQEFLSSITPYIR